MNLSLGGWIPESSRGVTRPYGRRFRETGWHDGMLICCFLRIFDRPRPEAL